MSTYDEFLRDFEKRVEERSAELVKQIVVGTAVQSLETYRERVGELRGLSAVAEMIRESEDHVNARTTKT